MTRSDEELKTFRTFYAHRGLYDNEGGVPENSLAAFRKAAGENLGAELDVALSKDGKVVVFHDDDLDRMCGVTGKIWDYTWDELSRMKLKGSEEGIPLFEDVLRTLENGRGPLIVELKNGPRNSELCEKTYGILKNYRNPFCIESFNPFIVKWFRKNAPEVIRGQLATKVSDYIPGQKKITAKLLSGCFFSFINKPDFIAYNIDAVLPENVKRRVKKGTMLFAWTSASPEEDIKKYDGVIFERRNSER